MCLTATQASIAPARVATVATKKAGQHRDPLTTTLLVGGGVVSIIAVVSPGDRAWRVSFGTLNLFQ